MIILGIDYGLAKVGLAVGDEKTGLIEPVGIIKNSRWTVSSLLRLINKLQVDKIVIGIPEGRLKEKVEIFGETLRKMTGLAIEFFDEALTTLDARTILGRIKRKRRYKKEMEDAIAAAVILKSYFERKEDNHV